MLIYVKYLLCTIFIGFNLKICMCERVEQSIPFAPFRMECKLHEGMKELQIFRVDSSQKRRRDLQMTAICDSIPLLFPAKSTELEHEREECLWLPPFDPFNSNSTVHSCTGRQYLTGISRVQYNTEINFLCCRLRTRELKNCISLDFADPVTSNSIVRLRNDAYESVIGEIAYNSHARTVTATFCELGQRDPDSIASELDEERNSLTSNERNSLTSVEGGINDGENEDSINRNQKLL